MPKKRHPPPDLPDPPGRPAGNAIGRAVVPRCFGGSDPPPNPPVSDTGGSGGVTPPTQTEVPLTRAEAMERDGPPPGEDLSAWARHQARRLLAELAARRAESLGLYEPLSQVEGFHKSRARNRLLIGANRSGKTLAAAVEMARAVCGTDPYDKYPKSGLAFLVGKDQKHLGTVMFPKLFKPGAYFVIRDLVTGCWRPYRPWQEPQREAEKKPAPPLIPGRLVREIAWENKKENVPSVVRLTTGWEMCFYSSLGKPPQGQGGDAAWLDEEVIDPSWYPELAARLAMAMGRLWWSATPQAGTDQLFELHERAERERKELPEGKRSVEEFHVALADNPHMSDEAKVAFAKDLGDEEFRVRVLGEYAIVGYKVYPTFSMATHGYSFPEGEDVPPGWTLYGYVDPGHRVCACLLVAVPPPQEGDFYLLCDEVYVREATADSFAGELERVLAGRTPQAFVMDSRMAVQTQVGSGMTVMRQYAEALAAHNVSSVATGPGFLLASDDVEAGILAVQGLLRPRDGADPRLRVLRGRLPNFEDEVKRYHRKRVAGVLTNKPDQRKDNHLLDACRYMALHRPQFVPFRKAPEGPRGAIKDYRLKLARRREKEHAGGAYGINLGPGVSRPWHD
jgi:hypothetical protein